MSVSPRRHSWHKAAGGLVVFGAIPASLGAAFVITPAGDAEFVFYPLLIAGPIVPVFLAGPILWPGLSRRTIVREALVASGATAISLLALGFFALTLDPPVWVRAVSLALGSAVYVVLSTRVAMKPVPPRGAWAGACAISVGIGGGALMELTILEAAGVFGAVYLTA